MRHVIWFSLSCALAAVNISARAETVVAVAFIHPEKFTDAAPYGGLGLKAEQPALTEIGRWLEGLGARYLAPHQSLIIDVTDLDLAGEYEPRLRSYDVRVMRDVYPPRIKIHYRLTENGHSVVEGDELVYDMNYLANPAARMIQ